MILDKFVNNFDSRETSWSEQLELALFVGIIGSLLIPIRYVIPGLSETILGYFSDFTAISLYLSQVFVILYIIQGVYKDFSRGDFLAITKILVLLIVFWVILSLTNLSSSQVLFNFSYLRIICALLLGYYVYKSNIWLKYNKFIVGIIICLGSINAAIALIQFCIQHSLGLNLLGESPIQLTGYGIAKVVAHGTNFIRGYGLFPHPNILSAILATISILNLYLLTKTTQIPRFCLWVSFCLLTAGLFVTFSRAGIFAFGLGFTTWWILNYRSNRKRDLQLAIIPIMWLIIISSIFFPWLSQRASWSDQAVSERGVLNSAGLEIIKQHWLVGTGPGTNLETLHGKLSKQYDFWQIQPIHNYFLISIAELGLAGLVICIVILYFFYKIFRKTLSSHFDSKQNSDWLIALTSISVIIFTLFWFDHYFYTIWPSQILLWIFIGLMAKEIKIPSLISE